MRYLIFRICFGRISNCCVSSWGTSWARFSTRICTCRRTSIHYVQVVRVSFDGTDIPSILHSLAVLFTPPQLRQFFCIWYTSRICFGRISYCGVSSSRVDFVSSCPSSSSHTIVRSWCTSAEAIASFEESIITAIVVGTYTFEASAAVIARHMLRKSIPSYNSLWSRICALLLITPIIRQAMESNIQ